MQYMFPFQDKTPDTDASVLKAKMQDLITQFVAGAEADVREMLKDSEVAEEFLAVGCGIGHDVRVLFEDAGLTCKCEFAIDLLTLIMHWCGLIAWRSYLAGKSDAAEEAVFTTFEDMLADVDLGEEGP